MKILLISYYFDPCIAIGARRWSILHEQLEKLGVDITVLSGNWIGKKRANIHYLGEAIEYLPPASIIQDSFLGKLKHPSEFFRSLSFELFKKKDWIKNCECWFEKNKNKKFDFVITSYSPITSLIVANKTRLIWPDAKLIIDFRDLISIQGQKIRLPVVHQLDCFLDKLITRKMTGFITIGNTTFKKAQEFYKKPGLLCFNGINEMPNIEYREIRNDKIVISYFGTLSRFRNPKKVVDLLGSFALENHIKIEIRFYSNDNPFNFNLVPHTENIKLVHSQYVKDVELARAYSESDIFLLLENINPQGNENVTGKLFDYLSVGKPILAFCNKESDIFYILKLTNSGAIVNTPNDVTDFFQKYVFQKTRFNESGLKKLTAKHRAAELIEFLDDLRK